MNSCCPSGKEASEYQKACLGEAGFLADNKGSHDAHLNRRQEHVLNASRDALLMSRKGMLKSGKDALLPKKGCHAEALQPQQFW